MTASLTGSHSTHELAMSTISPGKGCGGQEVDLPEISYLAKIQDPVIQYRQDNMVDDVIL